MNHRESGRIEDVRGPEIESHGIRTVYVYVHFDSGGTQGFGGLCFGGVNDEEGKVTAKAFIDELCRAFGVKSFEALEGKKCSILKSFSGYNETIEGLECPETKKRFTITGFRKKHYPDQAFSPLNDRQKNLKQGITRMKAEIVRSTEQLRNLSGQYVDWETAE